VAHSLCNVCPSVTLCGAETIGQTLILKSGDGVDLLRDGAEGILVSLTLSNRRLEPENHERTVMYLNLSIDFD
jgi:hypothetical protein